jgi:hypothetical protein
VEFDAEAVEVLLEFVLVGVVGLVVVVVEGILFWAIPSSVQVFYNVKSILTTQPISTYLQLLDSFYFLGVSIQA